MVKLSEHGQMAALARTAEVAKHFGRRSTRTARARKRIASFSEFTNLLSHYSMRGMGFWAAMLARMDRQDK
jgi:hypothetical protein